MGYVKLVFFMIFPFLCQLSLSFCSSLSHLCPKDQALALQQFKHMFTISHDASDYCFDLTDHLIQSYPKTLSWNKSTDCCSWDGVYCDETTGKVIELNLTCSKLQDNPQLTVKFSTTKWNSSASLMDLFLSGVNATGRIPESFGHLTSMRTLELFSCSLSGSIPKPLGNLTNIEELDLGDNHLEGPISDFFRFGKLRWLSLDVLNLSHNYLVGCIPKGKQFDTFENSSYQGNDGLRGLPLSKDCGGDEGVPQATTQVGLDEGEEGDSAIISWQAVLMGYGCGLVIGLSIIYIMLSTQYPAWFSRMDVKLEHKILTRMRRHKKRH